MANHELGMLDPLPGANACVDRQARDALRVMIPALERITSSLLAYKKFDAHDAKSCFAAADAARRILNGGERQPGVAAD